MVHSIRTLRWLSIAVAGLVLVTAGIVYSQVTTAVTRPPQIITVVMPVANAGADAAGMTFPAWAKLAEGWSLMARREHNMAWRPVPVDTFAPGDTLMIRRVSCYVDKAAVDGVDTVLVGTGKATGHSYRYPSINPPKRTVAEPPEPSQRSYGPVGNLGACDAYNYAFTLPARGALGDDGTPLWISDRVEWYLQTSVRFTGFVQPAYHPWTYITVAP